VISCLDMRVQGLRSKNSFRSEPKDLARNDQVNIMRGTQGQASLQYEKRQGNLPMRHVTGINTATVYHLVLIAGRLQAWNQQQTQTSSQGVPPPQGWPVFPCSTRLRSFPAFTVVH